MRFALGTVLLFRMDVETKADPLTGSPHTKHERRMHTGKRQDKTGKVD
jgi:hypothetical protein